MTSGMAMRMKLDLARYRRSPPSFTPPPLLDPVDHDVLVEGYAAPATIDREWMKFAPYCWFPLPQDIPLLFRHDRSRPAGRILAARTDDNGLWIKALVSDAEARRCSYFSVAATIHDYRIRQPDDDKQAFALIINATLDEVSIVNDNPGNPDARILYRDRPEPAALKYFDLMSDRVHCAMKHLELIQQVCSQSPPPAVKQGDNITLKRKPAPPRRSATAFTALVTELQRRHPL